MFWQLPAGDAALLAKWQRLREIRDGANKEIETLRAAGGLGSSLQAGVAIGAEPADAALLRSLGEDLKFVLITSAVEVNEMAAGTPLQFAVRALSASKCERCWHWRDDVGADAAHPTLCGRCTSNLHGEGERRQFA